MRSRPTRLVPVAIATAIVIAAKLVRDRAVTINRARYPEIYKD